ncbi:MAG: CoA pyrophosphatase [Chitinophagaceae bacterium]|nr:CoA pyrophosphatase [Chitinophagaceae bacterium]
MKEREYETFIFQIKTALLGELPGIDAQKKLSPSPDSSERFHIEGRTDASKSAVLILFYPTDNKNPHFPLIQKPKNSRVHSNQIAFPGGRYEEQDTNLFRTALRETQEEIGIDASTVHIIGNLTSLYIPISNFILFPVVGFLDYSPTFIPDNNEVAKIIPAPVEWLLHTEIKTKNIPLYSIHNTLVPCYEIENHVIWGATAMVLSELYDLLKQNKGKYLL